MNRGEFISRLTELLQDLSPAEREEAIQYYNDYLDDAGDENLPEVIAALGTPEELAQAIRTGLSEEDNAGEFTESGYRGKEATGFRNEMVAAGDIPKEEKRTAPEFESNPDNSYYQKHYYENTNGKGVYGKRVTEGEPMPKKKMSTGSMALIITLIIITFPIWISVLATVFALMFAALVTVVALVAAFVVTGIALVVGAGLAFVIGFTQLIAAPIGGLSLIGAALIMLALGILFVWLLVMLCVKAIPAICRGFKSLWNKIFHRGGKKK